MIRKTNNSQLLLGAALLGTAAASQAAFITTDAVSQAGSTINIVSSNYFRTTLAGLGVNSYMSGTSLATDVAGSVTYYYYGKEGGYKNDFLAGDLAYSTGFASTKQSRFGAPIEIGTVDIGAGLLDFGFCAYSAGPVGVGCVTNAQNDALGMSSFQSIAMSIIGDTAWLFWDDSGTGRDDNHDDMLIKAVFTPSVAVPEPATLALFGLGLLGWGVSANRRQRKAMNA